MACNKQVPDIIPIRPQFNEEESLDVISRYQKLMVSSTGDDSLYSKSKETIFELSKDLNMTESQRMEIVSGQITQMTVGLSGSAMQTALSWAKEDAGVGYATAILKEQASKAAADAELVMAKVCTEEKSEQLQCAQIESTIAGSIRDNGRVDLYDATDKCKPIAIKDEGLKYQQTRQVTASTYQILADAYRKSGVVDIGESNGTIKGLDGDRAGHTYAQTGVANRQILSFEDSKRNHAVNASSQTIGQLIAAEAQLDDKIVNNYNTAMDYLLKDSTPVIPGGPASLDGVNIFWDNSKGTDQVDGSGFLFSQQSSEQITTGAMIDPSSNVRNGDYIILKVNSGNYYTRQTISVTDIDTNGYVLLTFPSEQYNSSGASVAYYDLEVYVQDMAGNTSPIDAFQLKVKYNPTYGL